MLSDDGKTLYIALDDKRICIYSMEHMFELGFLNGHEKHLG